MTKKHCNIIIHNSNSLFPPNDENYYHNTNGINRFTFKNFGDENVELNKNTSRKSFRSMGMNTSRKHYQSMGANTSRKSYRSMGVNTNADIDDINVDEYYSKPSSLMYNPLLHLTPRSRTQNSYHNLELEPIAHSTPRNSFNNLEPIAHSTPRNSLKALDPYIELNQTTPDLIIAETNLGSIDSNNSPPINTNYFMQPNTKPKTLPKRKPKTKPARKPTPKSKPAPKSNRPRKYKKKILTEEEKQRKKDERNARRKQKYHEKKAKAKNQRNLFEFMTNVKDLPKINKHKSLNFGLWPGGRKSL